MKTITLNQLLESFWRFSEPIERHEILKLDWDELMLALEISCPDAEKQEVYISDIDMTTYRNPAVSFTINE